MTERRFLLTGAKGFIGSWVVKTLIERGSNPWVFDQDLGSQRLESLLTDDQLERIHFVEGDITQIEELEKAVVTHGITHLIHLAALQVPYCAADPPLGARVNVVGTLNIFEVARRHRDQIQRVVYASSQAVFGPEEYYGKAMVPEGAPLLPNTHYGVFKQANEGNARVYYLTDGISSIGLRPGTVYGAGRDRGITSGPTKAIKAAIAGRPYTIKLIGSVDMQYVRDTAEIFIRSAESNVQGANVYTPRGEVIEIENFLSLLGRVLPQSKLLFGPRANHCPSPSILMTVHWSATWGPLPELLSIRASARQPRFSNGFEVKTASTWRILIFECPIVGTLALRSAPKRRRT